MHFLFFIKVILKIGMAALPNVSQNVGSSVVTPASRRVATGIRQATSSVMTKMCSMQMVALRIAR
jgi:hypothetical protein